jgi:hypothetical protein
MVMNKALQIFALALVSAAAAHAAQLYRWVDSKGNVEWRDTPPPVSAAAKKVEARRVGGNVIESGDPYSLQVATKNHPVTFWGSSDCGKVCDTARAHLTRRGVPFADKDPKTDFEGFTKVSPNKEVPVLQVGAITVKGYLDSEWDSTLDNAGYPRTAIARPKAEAKPPQPALTPASQATK